MSGFERQQVNTLLTRLEERPERLIVVSGPRQTGKTTLVTQALARTNMGGEYLSIDEPEPATPSPSFKQQEQEVTTTLTEVRDAKWLTRTWEDARKKANHSDRGFVLVLDEIQKIPQWSETVKGLWDADRAADCPLHVVVLGSAPLLMQQGLTESLAGRFELIRVSHWSFPEMVDAFNFDLASYIYFGGYPGSAYLINDQPRWREYIHSSLIEPNIERDILSMTRVNKPALLKRAFELGSNYSGQILSYTKMQGQLQDAGNTTTLAHYLDLLSNAGLLTGLQKYAGQQHRRRGSSPKLNVLNTSFMAVNSGYSFEEAQADRTFWGRLVESTVGAHLFNTGMPDIRLHYWRESPYEVDFVLEKGRRLIGIEVKSTPRGNNSDGLSIFQERFSPERTLLVGGQGIPLEEFLTQPATHWFDSS
ncbi:MAG: ATP-binding protein [Gammaproteobacteria bacterium]|nr:MAG: ATP-binding protein [Gammaproteobacteria bacterium]